MEIHNTFSAIKRQWTTITLVTLLAGGLALLLSALQPQEYSSEIKMLIIQKQNFETDTYLAAKSAEKVGNNLSEVLSTSSFLDKVVAEGSVDLSVLTALDTKDRHDAWSQKVSANVIPDSGLLSVTAYDEDPEVAQKLAMAVASVMTNSANEYHGGGDSIVIKIVDEPLTSTYPVRPNILVNVAVAMVLGLVLSITVVFLRNDIPFKSVLKIRQKYSVLEPSHVPQFDQSAVLSSSSEPITMYDHLN